MKIIILILTILFVVSCESDTQLDRFAESETNLKYEINTVLLNDFKAVDKEYERIYNLDTNPDKITYEAGERFGFSYFKNDVCYVVLASPNKYSSLKEFERTLGHEHLHCIYGSWHR